MRAVVRLLYCPRPPDLRTQYYDPIDENLRPVLRIPAFELCASGPQRVADALLRLVAGSSWMKKHMRNVRFGDCFDYEGQRWMFISLDMASELSKQGRTTLSVDDWPSTAIVRVKELDLVT